MHLEGKPSDIGFQHGYLLAPGNPGRAQGRQAPPYFARVEGLELFPEQCRRESPLAYIEQEYRDESTGIAAGLAAKNVKLDIWDVVATNARLVLDPYYV